MKKLIIIVVSLLITVTVGLTFYISNNKKTINTKEVYFTVEKGASFDKITKKLMDKGIVRSQKFIRIYARLENLENVKAGSYIASPRMNLKDFLLKLNNGKSDYTVVTIPEGYTLYQIGSKLEKLNLANRDSILKSGLESVDNNLIKPNNKVIYQLEGYLFPDTYYIPVKASKDEIIKIMFDRFNTVFSEKYKNRAKELGLSVNEAITVASLIEKEAANDEERSKIAGVIYNRIKKGMPLQIDASVIYAITKGEKSLNKVYYKNLKTPSLYNTYLNKGLPPGPIASPGKASIEAALYPENHEYLYYVLGEKGHIFSKTYSEHVKNVNNNIK